MKSFIVIFSVCITALTVFAQDAPRPLRPVHTFSIVARDPVTGDIGAAVQSHWFAVGSNVIWAEAGVGAVATQSFIDPSYGPLGLALMKAGKSGPDALKSLLSGDSGRDVRQVAFVDVNGHVASWTGARDTPAAGGVVGTPADRFEIPDDRLGAIIAGNQLPSTGKGYIGQGFAAQANLMSNDKVWPAMAKAYQDSKGDLAERLLAALEAGQAAGGDIRGRQSAAIIVVKAKSSGKPWADKIFDLRVDDAAEPIKELRRLVALQRAYNHMNAGDAAVEKGDHDLALKEYSAAEDIATKTEGVLPSRVAEMIFWHAVELVSINRVDESLPLFQRVFQMEPNYVELTKRLPTVGLLPNDPAIIQKVVAQSK